MPSDQQLVARILSGDTAAVPELEEKYRSSLTEVAQEHLGMSQYEAEEAVQQLFVGLLADDAAPLRRFGWRCALSTWLYALIPHKDPVPSKQAAPTAPLGEDIAERAPQAFAGLTDRHRLLLQFAAADGLTYSEMARLIRGSMGEVTSSVYSAKLELSQALGILPPPRPEPPAPEELAEPVAPETADETAQFAAPAPESPSDAATWGGAPEPVAPLSSDMPEPRAETAAPEHEQTSAFPPHTNPTASSSPESAPHEDKPQPGS